MKAKLLLLGLLVLAGSARAQEGSPTAPPRPAPPTGSLLQSAPEFSQWEVDFTYTDDATKREKSSPDTGMRLHQVAVVKTGKIIHEHSTYVGGQESDKWYNDKLQYEKSPTAGWRMKNGLITKGIYDDPTYIPFPSTGFRDLDWINAKTYVGTISFGSHQALVFSKIGADKLDLSDPAKQKKLLDAQQSIAYIDAESRLPVSVRAGPVVCVYHFTAPPTEMQKFPDDLAVEIKKGDNARIRLLQLAPRPY